MKNLMWQIGLAFHRLGLHLLCNEVGALGNWPKGMVEDRYDWLFEGYDESPSMIDTIFEIKTPTEGMYDQRTTAIAMGKLVQKSASNTSVTYRRPSEGFTAYCVYRDFDDGLQLEKNEVERFPAAHTKALVKDAVTDWGRGLRLTEDDFAATLFTRGGFTAGDDNFKNVIANLISQNTDGLAYDAKPFFTRVGNERTSKGGGTYFNAISTAPLTVTNYATLHDRVFITNARNERDERINTKGMGIVAVIIPPQLRDEAVRALESEYLPGTDQNDKNPYFKAAKIVEWDALRANAATWYLGVLKKGIAFYRAGKPEIRMFRDEDTGAYKATVRALYGYMPWNFRFHGGADVPTS